ncbi:GNAT family N-acetyltransferase [Gloeocapsopsis sp. IPPAS B-1203]|uniref:GNAT family N-acetyltransferase n=1 Tax=Gloeocapsopsis sp. IPPAS B-1203 TaxID=2049454 RepID=UPI0025A2705B|nr:GNAT family N-acetyltransferase [Gloeocapsopsis sp. IPPAS B-1203]
MRSQPLMEMRRLQENDCQLLASAIWLLIPESDRGGNIASHAYLKQALADKNCYFILCVVDSTPIGYLSAFRFPAVESTSFQVYLYDIVVDEKFRRKGIGTRMIEELKRCCIEDQISRIWVGTSLDNEAAKRTFEITGARKVGETYVEYIYYLDEGA